MIEDIFYEQTLRCCFNITVLLSTVVSHLRSYVLDGWAVDCSIAWYLLIKTNNLVVKFKVKSHDISSLPGLEETENHDHDKIIIFHPHSVSHLKHENHPKPWSSSSSSSVTALAAAHPKFSRRNANLGIEMFQTVTVKLSKSIWAIGHSLVQPPILSKTKTWIKWIFPRKISPSKLIIYANNFPISVREI